MESIWYCHQTNLRVSFLLLAEELSCFPEKSDFIGDCSIELEDMQQEELTDGWHIMCSSPLTEEDVDKKLGKRMVCLFKRSLRNNLQKKITRQRKVTPLTCQS